MKNLKFLFTTLLLLCSIVVSAHDFEVGGIYYNITDETNKTVEVTFRGKYNDSYSNEYTGSVVIPESVSYGGTTYSVTSIGSNAFNECSVLTSIIIPNSVTSIGGYAFNDCSGLTSIEIPNSVTSIGDYAFESTAWYNNQPEGLLVMDGWLLGYKGEKPTGELVIPSNVTNIASSAFSGCSGLTSIEIPNSVTSIGDWAFYYCYGLTSIEIPNSVTSIGDGAFYNCSGLTSIEIPNSVTSIGEKAFYYCDGLTSVTIPNSVTSIGYDAFYGCSGLTSIEIPNSVTSIGNFAFYGCANLKTVINFSNLTFSKGSSDYGYVAYYVDKVINVPNGFVEGDFLFGKPGDVNTLLYYLGNDAELTLPQSCNGENYVIAADVFKNNTSITSIEIPNSVTSIGDYAFEYCSGLTSITIPNSVTSLGNYAFSGCSGLTSIEIPNSVTSIGNGAFYGCSGLTSVTIPNSVTSIGESAFKGCSGLTSITIPNSVTSIGYCAFESTAWYNNQSEGVVYAGKFLYRYKGTMPANTSIVVKEGTTQICNSAFSGCSGLTSVTIPNSVTSIGGEAFYRCNNLKTVINYSNLTFSKGSSNYGFVAYYVDKVINAPNAFFEGDFVFSVIDGVNTLAVYLGNDTEITLPNDYNGESYVVGESAFRGYSNLTSIEIPNSVTSIGSSAFYGCFGLKSVTIGNSVTSIGSSAFSGCSGLTSVTIPNSVTSIGGEAFYRCNNLKTVINYSNLTFSKGSSNYGYVAYYANKVINAPNAFFEGDFVFSVIDSVNTLAVYLGNDTEITLPNDYNGESYVVGESAFRGYSNLTSIEIPNSVTSIGSSAFYGCSGLKSVTIGNSVTSIGRSAFYGCSGLTSIEIPNSVTSIGGEAFSGCSGLTSIVIPNSVTSIGYQAFKDCGNIETLYVSSSIESIGDEAFVGCDKITEIKIGLEKPIRASANIFSYAAYDNAVLYIPNGTKSLYEKREPWNLFFYIEEIENITPTYSVTFMLDGDVYATYTLEVGAEIPTFNKPIKEGYTFSGWSEIPATMPAEDIVVSGFFIKDDTAVDDVKEQTTENNVVYDLQGRVVENPTKGIYIINGKKMLVK